MTAPMPPEPAVTPVAEPSLIEMQRGFCNYLRDPENHGLPTGLGSRRLNVYRDLVFNNVESLLGNAYPVIKSIMGEQWRSLVREFFVDYKASTPYFTRLGKEFFYFLREREGRWEQPDYLTELACYELLELELNYREGQDTAEEKLSFSDAGLVFSSLAELAQYRYPVHQLSKDYLPDSAPAIPTFILMYRNADDRVVFFQLSEFAFQLLTLIDQQPGYNACHWMDSIVDNLPQQMEEAQKQQFIVSGLTMLERFHTDKVLLGV